MITGVEIQKIYKEIQRQLFYMIPEKWNRVYLYASIVEGLKNVQAAEMFFYYYPDGIIKKKPVNVYEIPNKFNVDEAMYMELADNLYNEIRKLKEYTTQTGEDDWGSVTISIENLNFIIEYDYNNIKDSDFSSNDRRIVWIYKNLDFPLNAFTRKERKIIYKYESETRGLRPNSRVYMDKIKHRYVNNIIDYNNSNYDNKVVMKKEEKFEAEIMDVKKKDEKAKKKIDRKRKLFDIDDDEVVSRKVSKSQFLINEQPEEQKMEEPVSQIFRTNKIHEEKIRKPIKQDRIAKSQFLLNEEDVFSVKKKTNNKVIEENNAEKIFTNMLEMRNKMKSVSVKDSIKRKVVNQEPVASENEVQAKPVKSAILQEPPKSSGRSQILG